MQRRRRPRNRYLENLGSMSPGTMLAFGLALILLLASIAIVGAALVRRGSAAPQVAQATPSPTEFLALVETPVPTPEIVTATVVVTPTAARATATATRPRATPTTIVNAPLGSGQSRAARGLAGAMAAALGGTLPPVAAAPPPTPTKVPTVAPPTVRPYTPPPAYNPPAVSNPPIVSNPPVAPTATPTPRPTLTPTPRPLPTQTPTPPPSPTAPPSPTVPPLPPVALPTPAPRPYSYNLTYTLQADLAAVPGSDYAYTVTWHTFTAAEVATLKGALGLKGPVQQTATGFTVTDPGTLTIDNQTGTLTYTAPGVTAGPEVSAFASPTVTAQATGTAAPSATRAATTTTTTNITTAAATATAAPQPKATAAPPTATPTHPGPTPTPAPLSDDAALAAAKQWLSTSALLPPNADGGHVTRPTTDEIVVTYRPKSPGPLILGDPAVVVTLDAKGNVRTATYRWPEDVTQRPVRLRPAADAWADAQAGKGYLQVDQTIPANLPNGTVFKGAATVTSVDIGWTTATNDSGTYLVPVYVFSGTVVLTGQPQGTPPVPFHIYVPAVAPATP